MRSGGGVGGGRSIDALREKRVRTVFRLTLVKDKNVDEVTFPSSASPQAAPSPLFCPAKRSPLPAPRAAPPPNPNRRARAQIDEYAALVRRGAPHFVEVKGVTFCGQSSKAADITMGNVPWHHEVGGGGVHSGRAGRIVSGWGGRRRGERVTEGERGAEERRRVTEGEGEGGGEKESDRGRGRGRRREGE